MSSDTFLTGLSAGCSDPFHGTEATKNEIQEGKYEDKDSRRQTWWRQVVHLDVVFGKCMLSGSGVLIPDIQFKLARKDAFQWVLTAAHCVTQWDDGVNIASRVDVLVLGNQVDSWKLAPKQHPPDFTSVQQAIRVEHNRVVTAFREDIFVHPNYMDHPISIFGFDFALIRLPEAFWLGVVVGDSRFARDVVVWDTNKSPSSFQVVGFPGELKSQYASQDPSTTLSTDRDKNIEKGFKILSSNDDDKLNMAMDLSRQSEARKRKWPYKFERFWSEKRYRNFVVALYSNQSSAGMSGGALYFDDKLVGVHTYGGINDIQGGSLITSSVFDWMYRTQIEHQLPVESIHEAIARIRKKELIQYSQNGALVDSTLLFDLAQTVIVKESFDILRAIWNYIGSSINFSMGTLSISTALLHHACSTGTSMEIFDFLLLQGANIFQNTVGVFEREGYCGLHLTVENENVEIARKLVSLGLHVDTQCGICAGRAGNVRKGWTPLTLAASLGRVNMARALVELNASLEAINSLQPPLAYASANGRVETVRLLLELKADINNPNGLPLSLAVSSGRMNVVGLLLEMGAHHNLQCGDTTFLAVECDQVEILGEFLKRGIGEPNELLQKAIHDNAEKCVEFLIQYIHQTQV